MKKSIILVLLLVLFSCTNNEKNNSEKQEINNKTNNEVSIGNDENGNINLKAEDLKKEANSFFENKNYSKAIDSYEEVLKLGKLDGEIMNNLFVSYIYTMNYQKAFNLLNLSIQNIGPKEELVGSYISENNLSDKIVKLQKQIRENDNVDENVIIEYATSIYQAGDYYYELDKQKYYFAIMLHYISAYLVLEDAQNINEDNSMVYFYKGRLIMDIGSPNEFAIKELQKAIELKDDDFRYYYRLGNAYMHEDMNKLAKETFLKGIALNDKYEKLHLNLGNIYFRLNERKKGYESYDKGIKVCSEMCDSFYYNIGNELLEEGKKQEAKKSYEKSLEINPNKTEAKEKLNEIK